MTIQTIKGPRGWTLVMDKPAMVYSPKQKQWASYGCATDTGEVTGIDGSVKEIPVDVMEWLEDQEMAVSALWD